MAHSLRFCRIGSAWLLLSALLLLGAVRAFGAVNTPLGVRLDVCGAMSVEPGLGEAVSGGGSLRPAEILTSGDKAFGCRFTLVGVPQGNLENVEVRLSRPGAVAGSVARDRWFVPVRRGASAVAAYAFADPGAVREGVWTLELYLADAVLAQKRFEVVAAGGTVSPPPVARRETPAPRSVEPSAVFAATPDGPKASGPATSGNSSPRPEASAVVAIAPEPAAPPVAATAAPAVLPAPVLPPAKEVPPHTSPVIAAKTAEPPVPSQASAKASLSSPTKASAAAVSPERKQAKPPAALPEKSGPSPSAKVAAPAVSGYYALQTGLFSDVGNAEGQAARLRSRGLPACLAVEGGGDKRRYRVLAGRYSDRRAALALRPEVMAVAGNTPVLFQVDVGLATRLRCH
ncbi:MAG: SPOR domain-containing protein [Solidesulfovibrio sp.]